MRSRRLPPDLEPNPWTLRLALRRANGDEVLDLTETNPTRVGLTNLTESQRTALATAAAEAYDPDPRGLRKARAAVATLHAGSTPNDIVLTSGTSESYAHLFRLLADPGDAILIPAPSYPLFEPIAALEGIEVARYRLAYDGAWYLDIASLDEALDRHPRARAVVVVQPNHPTGSALDHAEIEALEQRCEARGLALISDEVFIDFRLPPNTKAVGSGPIEAVSLLGSRRVPTFVLGGLSKSCGLPQLKLGWIVACGPPEQRADLLYGLEWIADTFLSVATPVQIALPQLLEGRANFRQLVQFRIAVNLGFLEFLVERCPEVSVLEAVAGWSAVLRVPARRTGEAWALELLDRGVAVHPGHFYDLEGEAFLVLSLIPQHDVFRNGVVRLAEVLTNP